MKVLVVGSGGREHALAWGLARSPSVREVWSAPGNPGTAALGPVCPTAIEDLEGLVELARSEAFDLVVVGPEGPLVAGLSDRLVTGGTRCFGPSAGAARLEGSKAFAKTLMARAGVPTAPFRIAGDLDEAMSAVRELGPPAVLKADGLAAGKGVRIAYDEEEARTFAWEALVDDRFGEAGRRLVVEAFLEGEEASLFFLVDGTRASALVPARDYKRLGAGDVGPNTGGMGAHAPAELEPGEIDEVRARVVEPVLRVLRADGIEYRGLLYCGLMRTRQGPSVLEFNCRFGDPETQVVVPLLDGDWGRLLLQTASGRLEDEPRWRNEIQVGVVLAAPGYPDRPRSGGRVTGIERAAARDDTLVFHAGTKETREGLVVSGGRVLTVVGRGASARQARASAYRALGDIELEGGQFREDIALASERAPAAAGREDASWQ